MHVHEVEWWDPNGICYILQGWEYIWGENWIATRCRGTSVNYHDSDVIEEYGYFVATL